MKKFLDAAIREFKEETGMDSIGPYKELGNILQKTENGSMLGPSREIGKKIKYRFAMKSP